MICLRLLMRFALPIALVCMAPSAAAQEPAAAVLKRASDAMGVGQLKSLRYAGEGIGYSFGRAYKPGTAWPKIDIHSFVRTINYETASMRDEIVLSRAEPRGGGGYPPVAQQRNDQFLSGAYTWNQTAAGPAPGPRYLHDRTHQLWITPHGVIDAALKHNATVQQQTKDGKALTALSFTMPGALSAVAFINQDNLVERVESRFPAPVLGETTAVTTYSDYRDFAGVKIPMRIQQSQADFPVLDLTVKDVQPNAPADIQVPDAVRNATERITTEKLADGVWFIAGASHNSVVIEMRDYLVLVETPLNDGRSVPVIEQTKKLVPSKPIRYVINTHAHFDHAGGVRAAVAEGAIIVTQEQNRPYYERAFAVPSKLSPDRLAVSGKKARFETVRERLALDDGTRVIEIHRVTDSDHSDSMLMVYLPKEKLLIEADAFTPAAPNTPAPAQPNPNHVNLIGNIAGLRLAIDRIVPLHGRVVPIAELYTATGAPLPK